MGDARGVAGGRCVPGDDGGCSGGAPMARATALRAVAGGAGEVCGAAVTDPADGNLQRGRSTGADSGAGSDGSGENANRELGFGENAGGWSGAGFSDGATATTTAGPGS